MNNPVWRRSSVCADGSCVEVAAIARRSSKCASSNCVEVEPVDDRIVLRDSKRPDESMWTTRKDFGLFVEGVKLGEFDDYTQEPAESDSEPLASDSPAEPSLAASVDDSAHCGPVPVNDHPAVLVCGYCEFADHCGKCCCCAGPKQAPAPHPLVAAVLSVTPIWDGEALVAVQDESDTGGGYAEPLYGDPAPIAAKQAAAVLRWLAEDLASGHEYVTNAHIALLVSKLFALADTIDPKETTHG